jgi:hypothetical protein
MIVKVQGADTYELAMRESQVEYVLHQRLSDLGCPHILRVYTNTVRQRTEAPHLGYIYMDYAPFGNLGELLRRVSAEKEE